MVVSVQPQQQEPNTTGEESQPADNDDRSPHTLTRDALVRILDSARSELETAVDHAIHCDECLELGTKCPDCLSLEVDWASIESKLGECLTLAAYTDEGEESA
jgi:hypothetical protein